MPVVWSINTSISTSSFPRWTIRQRVLFPDMYHIGGSYHCQLSFTRSVLLEILPEIPSLSASSWNPPKTQCLQDRPSEISFSWCPWWVLLSVLTLSHSICPAEVSPLLMKIPPLLQNPVFPPSPERITKCPSLWAAPVKMSRKKSDPLCNTALRRGWCTKNVQWILILDLPCPLPLKVHSKLDVVQLCETLMIRLSH